MIGKELQVLAIVKERGESHSAPVARKLGVSPKYTERILQGLAEDGYLDAVGDGRYALTPEGKLTLEPYKGRFMGQVPVSNYP